MNSSRQDTLLDIKAMLQAHADLLFQHLKYVSQIESGKVTDDDLIDYINELFNFRVSRTKGAKEDTIKKFKTEHLAALKATIKIRYGIYLKMISLASESDENAAKSALAIALKYQMQFAKVDEQLLKKNPTLKIKICTALHSVEFLKASLESLTKILPEEHRELVHCIDVETKSRKNNLPLIRIVFRWSTLSRRMQDILGKLMKHFGHKDPSFRDAMGNHSETSQIEGWIAYTDKICDEASSVSVEKIDAAMDTAPMYQKKISVQMDLASSFNAKIGNGETNDVELLEFVFQSVKEFYQIYPAIELQEKCFEQIINVSTIVRRETARIHKLKKRYDTVQGKVLHEMRNLFDTIKIIRKKLSDTGIVNEDIKEYTINVLAAAKECDKHAISFTKPFTLDTDINQVEARLTEYENAYQEVLASIETFNAGIDNYILEQTQAQAAKSDEEKRTKQVARETLLAEAKRKNQEYRDKVEQARHNKDNATTKVLPTAAVVTPVVVYKNKTVEERILNLNKEGIAVLTALFNFEKGLHYDRVCRVITEQLGGQIKEIGNGSSHKRIILDKYLIELTAHEGFGIDQSAVRKNSVATGGMFKQHGGSHQSGVMVRFNMELVVSTLIKAGITLEVLQNLTKESISPSESSLAL